MEPSLERGIKLHAGKAHCHPFFILGSWSGYFQVASLLEPAVDRMDCIRAQVYEGIHAGKKKE